MNAPSVTSGSDVLDIHGGTRRAHGTAVVTVVAADGAVVGGDADDDDDDRPLGMHPKAQRKTQFNMLAQQQFMQNQFQSPFGMAPAPFVGAPFTPFGPPAPPMAPMMMMPPQPPALPQDAAKFGRVDRWRHDVAVEGSTN